MTPNAFGYFINFFTLFPKIFDLASRFAAEMVISLLYFIIHAKTCKPLGLYSIN